MTETSSATLLNVLPEPDYLVPGLARRPRLGLLAGLFLLGIVLQTLTWGLLGLLVLAAAVVLALPRSVTNRPGKRAGSAAWKRVTRAEFAELFTMEAKGRDWGASAFDINCGRGFLALLGVLALAALSVLVLWSLQGGIDFESALVVFGPGLRAELLILDAALFFLPIWIFGMRVAWTPDELLVKARALHTILERAREYPDPDVRLTPMLEVGPVKGGALPRDARLFLTWPEGDEDFIGLQVQVSINNVQGTKYPYLYAVLVAQKGFDFGHEDFWVRKDVVEFEDGEEDVDVVVVRQKTSKTSGYHTEEDDQVRVFEEAMDLARRAQGLEED